MILKTIDAKFINKDVLENKVFKKYRVIPTKEFGIVEEVQDVKSFCM